MEVADLKAMNSVDKYLIVMYVYLFICLFIIVPTYCVR